MRAPDPEMRAPDPEKGIDATSWMHFKDDHQTFHLKRQMETA